MSEAEETLHKEPSREEIYETLIPQIASVLDGELDLIANLGNISSALMYAFSFHWVGFYRGVGDELVLGPFQGPPACTRIPFGNGVCGTAAKEMRTIVVPNVEEFPGHIACSSFSKSEIAVPLVHAGSTKLLLDIDSDKLDDFSELDSRSLEEIMNLIKKRHTI